MRARITQSLHAPAALFGLIMLASAMALAAAFTSQFAFHLAPCIMCLYQRLPFIAVIALSLIGLGLRRNERAANIIVALCALAFAINAGLAAYHSGIERHWWESAVEGCHVPEMSDNETADEWIHKILSRPSVPCGQIQWADPLFGLTMANYNIAANVGLFGLCAIWLTRRRAR